MEGLHRVLPWRIVGGRNEGRERVLFHSGDRVVAQILLADDDIVFRGLLTELLDSFENENNFRLLLCQMPCN